MQGRQLAAQKKRDKRIAEGNTGIPISEVPKLAWDTTMDFSESMANDPAGMSEHMLDLYSDFQAASKGFQAGSKFGPWGGGAGAVGGVVLRRGGKELVDKVFSLIRRGDEYVDAATGMKVDPTDSTYFMSKGSGGKAYNPNQTELKLEPFQSNTYQRSVLNKMNKYGMGDGTFRMKAYKAYLNKGDEGRDMLEAYLSPDRLRGSFEGYKKFNKKSVEYKWGAFLEKKGYNLSQGIQVHHINPLFDGIHLFDNVKFNSKEYWDLMDILIRNNARTGVIQKGDDINNLMMTLGQKADEATPHGIAHKFYNNFTPTFFSPAEMKKMNTVKGYRNKKAKRWATLVNKSEEVILEAHKQWSLLNPVTAQNLSFDELVDRLSNLDARGYNKLIDPKYQLPDMNSIIKEIAADKGLKGPIYRLNPPPVRDPSKITQLEQMTKEGDIINELRGMNKKPNPINPDQINIDDIFPDE